MGSRSDLSAVGGDTRAAKIVIAVAADLG